MVQAQEHDFITWFSIINMDRSLWRGTWRISRNLYLVSHVDVVDRSKSATQIQGTILHFNG